MTGDPKRNRTLVAGMASETYYHCATANGRKPPKFGHGLLRKTCPVAGQRDTASAF